MTDVVAATRDHVADRLASLQVPASRDANGDFFVHHGSTTAYVVVSADDGRAVLDIWAPVASDVPITPDLHRFVAEWASAFGRLAVEVTGDGIGQVVFTHVLLGEPLTDEVLVQVLGTVANTADKLDDEVIARFGGRRARA